MNKRIKELLEQSGLQPYYDGQQRDIEKFAELIVKECADIADQESRTQCTNIGVQVADRIWHTIRNRFGVK